MKIERQIRMSVMKYFKKSKEIKNYSENSSSLIKILMTYAFITSTITTFSIGLPKDLFGLNDVIGLLLYN